LIEVEPRCIRQLWDDPMTGERDWRLIRGNAPVGMEPGGVPGQDLQGVGPDGRPLEGDEEGQGGGGLPDGGAALGPIRGVRSRSSDEALKTFFGKNRYDQWLFTVDLLATSGGIVSSGGAGVPVPPTQ